VGLSLGNFSEKNSKEVALRHGGFLDFGKKGEAGEQKIAYENLREGRESLDHLAQRIRENAILNLLHQRATRPSSLFRSRKKKIERASSKAMGRKNFRDRWNWAPKE